VVGRECQCRRGSLAVSAPAPSSDEATYPQIHNHLALTMIANCNAIFSQGLGWWRRPGGEDKSGGT